MKKAALIVVLSMLGFGMNGQITWTVTCPSCINFPANDTVCAGQQLVINYLVYSSYNTATTFTIQSVITHPSPSTQTMTITTIQPSSTYTNTYTIPAPSSLGLHQVLVQIITYNAQATNSADDQTIQVISCGTTDINKENKDVIYKAFPVPNTGSFTLEIENIIENTELILINSYGQTVYKQILKEGFNAINTTGLSSGIYYYSIGQALKSGKLIIN
jgi:hypothetical protein